jgi:hypothetical protein
MFARTSLINNQLTYASLLDVSQYAEGTTDGQRIRNYNENRFLTWDRFLKNVPWLSRAIQFQPEFGTYIPDVERGAVPAKSWLEIAKRVYPTMPESKDPFSRQGLYAWGHSYITCLAMWETLDALILASMKGTTIEKINHGGMYFGAGDQEVRVAQANNEYKHYRVLTLLPLHVAGFLLNHPLNDWEKPTLINPNMLVL